jgi:hypothetical protein
MSQILVFPPAVPPVTPMNRGLFLMSNISGFEIEAMRSMRMDSPDMTLDLDSGYYRPCLRGLGESNMEDFIVILITR